LFLMRVTIPDVVSAGDTIVLAAASADPINGLTYFAGVPLDYSGGSVAPTAVPAGTGGLGDAGDAADSSGVMIAGGIGLALATAGAAGLRRRRVSVHR
jgi:hypothetical protein